MTGAARNCQELPGALSSHGPKGRGDTFKAALQPGGRAQPAQSVQGCLAGLTSLPKAG